MSPKHATVKFIFFQEWRAASLKKENIDWSLSDRLTTVRKKSLPGMNVAAEATAPYGERIGSAAAWWEAVRSVRILLKERSKVIIHWVPHIKGFSKLDITDAEHWQNSNKKLQNQQLLWILIVTKRPIFLWFLNFALSRACELHSARLQHSSFKRCAC